MENPPRAKLRAGLSGTKPHKYTPLRNGYFAGGGHLIKKIKLHDLVKGVGKNKLYNNQVVANYVNVVHCCAINCNMLFLFKTAYLNSYEK